MAGGGVAKNQDNSSAWFYSQGLRALQILERL